MSQNLKCLHGLINELPHREGAIVKELGLKIITLGVIHVCKGIIKVDTKCYDLAFKALDLRYKPSFCTFVTHSASKKNSWNKNEVPNSVMVQARFRGMTDPKEIQDPLSWLFFTKEIDARKGWFNFILKDATGKNLQYAFDLVTSAYNSFQI